jgi:hypothetical protein
LMVPLGERDMHAAYLEAVSVGGLFCLDGEGPLALARPISSFISKPKKFVRSVVDNFK